MKDKISTMLYALGYFICGLALKIKGIDRDAFNLAWANGLIEVNRAEEKLKDFYE